jgi:hypothetical protein
MKRLAILIALGLGLCTSTVCAQPIAPEPVWSFHVVYDSEDFRGYIGGCLAAEDSRQAEWIAEDIARDELGDDISIVRVDIASGCDI